MQGRVIIAARFTCTPAPERVHTEGYRVVGPGHYRLARVGKAAFGALATPTLELSADLATQATHNGCVSRCLQALTPCLRHDYLYITEQGF